MKLGRHEVALHEAGHIVVHAKIGAGYAERVRVGADSGWIWHYDGSLTQDFDLDLRAVLCSGGLAMEIIRGRDPFDRGIGDWEHMRAYSMRLLDDEQRMSVVRAAEKFLLKNWCIVEFASTYLLLNANRQGLVGKKACRKLYDQIRERLRIRVAR